MSTSSATRLLPTMANASFVPWAILLSGIAALYVPSLLDALRNSTQADDTINMLFVLSVSIWFLRFRVRQLIHAGCLGQHGSRIGGSLLLTMGLMSYALGRSQQLPTLEIASLVPVLAGIIALFFGLRTLARLWVVLFLLLFLVPLPASVASDITQPVKLAVSIATETVLHALGYPIARDGAMLIIGQYQLLVADACSGMRSLFTLEALGLMYVTSIGHVSALRNGLLATLIVPISFTANTLRVITLTLVTYYFGDAAGQGFLHNFAGMTLFASALLLIVFIDAVMTRVANRYRRDKKRNVADSAASPPSLSLRDALRIPARPALAVMATMLFAAGAANALTPHRTAARVPDLEAVVPRQFGDWREVPSPYAQVALSTTATNRDQPYDAILMRSYEASDGRRVMLALAYAAEQHQDVKIHRPEVCYPAQGFSLIETHAMTAPASGVHLLVRNRQQLDAVSYWIRIGDSFPHGVWAMRGKILRDGIAGRIDDGILVRVSSPIDDESQAPIAYAEQQKFLADLISVVGQQTPGLLVPVRTGKELL